MYHTTGHHDHCVPTIIVVASLQRPKERALRPLVGGAAWGERTRLVPEPERGPGCQWRACQPEWCQWEPGAQAALSLRDCEARGRRRRRRRRRDATQPRRSGVTPFLHAVRGELPKHL
eukprot:81749-Rhodomonas_salina.1